MGKRSVTMYVDIISPFGYIAYYLTRNSPAFKNVEVTYIPILLGGLMQSCGNTPPINIKNKDKWINLERTRWQKNFNIPMSKSTPQPFPQPTVNTQRALCYIQTKYPEKLPSAIDALCKAFWVESKTIGKVEVITEALRGVVDEKEISEGMKSEEAKKALKGNTERAFGDGAFGLPWFTATTEEGTEGFWGVDHIGQLLEFSGVETKGEEGFRAML